MTTKKLAGRPAAIALLRRVRSPSRSADRLFVDVTPLAVAATLLGTGLVQTIRPASVEFVQVVVPPVYAAGLFASREPLRYASRIGSGLVPVPGPKYANEPSRRAFPDVLF